MWTAIAMSEKVKNSAIFFVNFSSCDPLLNKDEKFSHAALNAKTLRRAGLKSLYLGAVAMNLINGMTNCA